MKKLFGLFSILAVVPVCIYAHGVDEAKSSEQKYVVCWKTEATHGQSQPLSYKDALQEFKIAKSNSSNLKHKMLKAELAGQQCPKSRGGRSVRDNEHHD